MVLYGHTPGVEHRWVNNTLCLDTGCCFGGALTAVRYPEREQLSVSARRVYHPPSRPLLDFPAASYSDLPDRLPGRMPGGGGRWWRRRRGRRNVFLGARRGQGTSSFEHRRWCGGLVVPGQL